MMVKELNDRFRSSFDFALGKIVITAGVNAYGLAFSTIAQAKVRQFDSFHEGNDPYDEHDFGTVFVNGVKIFWKIDYYDENFEYGAEDPLNCKRLLTIMTADEY